MKIGIIARMDRTGLGYQTKALYDLLQPSKVLVVDSTTFNGNEQIHDWYEDPTVSDGFITDELAGEFMEGLNVVISCETFYNDNLCNLARYRGIKTILQPNAELNPYFNNFRLPKPDAFFLPSTYRQRETMHLQVKQYYCPPPITMEYTPIQRRREGNLEVLHIQGKKALADRNGTDYVRLMRIPGVNITIASQGELNVEDNKDLYDQKYDVMLMPRRYGGLCLPMREALAMNLPVLMPAIEPNELLPKHWLFGTKGRKFIPMKGGMIPVHSMDIESMKQRIIQFRDMSTDEYQEQLYLVKETHQQIQEDIRWHELIKEVVE